MREVVSLAHLARDGEPRPLLHVLSVVLVCAGEVADKLECSHCGYLSLLGDTIIPLLPGFVKGFGKTFFIFFKKFFALSLYRTKVRNAPFYPL